MAGLTGKHSQKLEFSKLMVIIAGIINILVIIFACIMIVLTGDVSPLNYLVPAVAAEMASGSAFYYWKAKCENLIKLKQTYDTTPEELTEVNYQMENAASI